MPDIFISYKKEEGETASALARRLTEAGYDVWWDDALLAGERYEDEIAAVLDQCAAVVVLWSRQSVKSEWVKAEAEAARQQKKAFPIIIDDMPPTQMPLLYRGMHAARFEGWTGDLDHPGYVELIGSIRDRLGRASGPALTEQQAEEKLAETATETVRTIVENTAPAADKARPTARSPASKPRSSLLPWLALLLVVLIALGGGGTFLYMQMNALSPDDAARVDRCTTWALGGRIDWYTAVPPLQPTTADDCTKASARLPDNGDLLGMLAMVRVAQSANDAAQAVALANRAIDKGSAWGHYVMGLMYHQGINFAVDYARSATALKAAADMGLARAQGRLCLMGVDGTMTFAIPGTRDEILAFCARGEAAHDSFAYLAIGYLYETGMDGRAIDMAKAAEYYQRAYDLGDDDAGVRLGILYHRGVGVSFDVDRAIALYQEAANHGNPAGIRSMAIVVELGEGGRTADVNRASQMYEQAASRHDVPALLLAGYGLQTGVLTARQIGDANLLSGASTITASRIRGNMFAYGNLRTRDVPKAEQDLQYCSNQGNAICEAMIGYLHEYGIVPPRDAKRALTYYESSAGKGNMYGQYYLGALYEVGGDGVPADLDKALQYFNLAAAQGHLASQDRLAYYNRSPQGGSSIISSEPEATPPAAN